MHVPVNLKILSFFPLLMYLVLYTMLALFVVFELYTQLAVLLYHFENCKLKARKPLHHWNRSKCPDYKDLCPHFRGSYVH